MKKGLTRAGLGNVGPLESFIELASRHGFDSVDAGANELTDLIHTHGGVEGANDYLKRHRIVIGSIGLSVEWRKSEEQFRSDLTRLAQDAATAASLGCTSCCTYVLPSTDEPAAEFMLTATRRLRTCAQVLGAYGVRLGLEYVGPHHLRTTWKYPFIWDLPQTLAWIDVIREPNVGLLLDTIHWHTTSNNPAELAALTPAQIVHVHINDAPDIPVAEVLDNGRLFTGEGAIHTAAFLKAIASTGYKGVIAQEVLTQKPVEGTPDALMERSAAGFRKVYQAAGLE